MNDDAKISSLPELEDHLGYSLRRVSNHVSSTFIRALHDQQVSAAEWVALRQTHQLKMITPSGLADSMGMTRGAISKVIDKLQKKQWISRTISHDDSRVQILSLTPQGELILPQLAEIADRNEQHFFGCLSSAERATLRNLLEKLSNIHRWTDAPVD